VRPTSADDPEGPWIALLCVGILLTSLASTVCLGLIVLYAAKLDDVQPVLACFAAGALLMLGAAARLEHLAVGRARTHRR
jgi:hypothetical protein